METEEIEYESIDELLTGMTIDADIRSIRFSYDRNIDVGDPYGYVADFAHIEIDCKPGDLIFTITETATGKTHRYEWWPDQNDQEFLNYMEQILGINGMVSKQELEADVYEFQVEDMIGYLKEFCVNCGDALFKRLALLEWYLYGSTDTMLERLDWQFPDDPRYGEQTITFDHFCDRI